MSSVFSASRRETVLRIALVIGGLAAVIGVVAGVEATLRLADPELMVRRRGLQRYHARLGWENRPGARTSDGGITVSVDKEGRRRSGDAPPARVGQTHVLLLGDSVAFGLGVSDHDTFAASLTQGTPPYRVTNLAVPGYGPGQSLLRYQGLSNPEPDSVVVFALCLGNDLADVLARFHLYNEHIPTPRFVLERGSLVLEDAHVRRQRQRKLLDRSFLFARLAHSPEVREEQPRQVERRLQALRGHSPQAEDTLVAIVESMRRRTEAAGARFLVAAFPDQRTLDPNSIRWSSLRKKLEGSAAVLDLVPVLAGNREAYERNTLDHIGHLSRGGHQQAAKALREHPALSP